MAEPLSRAAPPPLTQQQQAQRKKQKRLIGGSVLGVLVLLGSWQAFLYFSSAPERAEAKTKEGIAKMSPGNYGEAVARFDEALGIDANSWNAYYQRGIAKQNLGQADAALLDLQAALQLKPDLMEAMVARAGIYAEKGDHQHAVEELTKVIAMHPDVDAFYRRGISYAALGQHERAMEDFTWVIETTRDAPYAYFARAKSKRALGDQEGATSDEASADSFDRARQ